MDQIYALEIIPLVYGRHVYIQSSDVFSTCRKNIHHFGHSNRAGAEEITIQVQILLQPDCQICKCPTDRQFALEKVQKSTTFSSNLDSAAALLMSYSIKKPKWPWSRREMGMFTVTKSCQKELGRF